MSQTQGQKRSAMECFNNLLLKLREVHEREVEGWQVKIQELSNKKGCDTKRMEELFTKNQQMKEQQRLLTENIKTLENRLRAGLCDRCTVTQEVAKRRQQEFEASQIQSLQHISVLAAEMNNMKKDNKRLREELRSLRAAHDSATEVKHNGSPSSSSPSSGPVALVTTAPSRAGQQPAGGSVAMKTEADHRTEEADHRRGMNRSHFESYKPISWKTEQSVARVGEMRRPQSVEGSIPRTPAGGEMNPSRHLLHAPVPCRPQPVKSSPVAPPWALTEPSEWVSAPGTSLVVRSSPKPNLSRFPNLIPTSQHANSRRQQVQQVFGPLWHKQSGPLPPAKEPTVVFRLRSQMPEHVENQTKPVEKREILPTKTESVSGEGACDGPLDLSGPGKSKSSQSPRYDLPLSLQRSPDMANPSAFGPISSPSPVVITSSSSTPTGQHEEESTSEQNREVVKASEQKDEVNRKTDHNNGKKVPILTISLRPVVVLENLNSALQKEESLSSNGKTSSPAAEVGSSSEEQDEEGSMSGQESSAGSKRKRASVEIETDRDSETENIQPERKIKITVRAEAKSPC